MNTKINVLIVLMTVTLLAGTAVAGAETAVFNGDFELLPAGVTGDEALGLIPYGWAAGYGINLPVDTWAVELTDERVLTGDYAMKITSNETGGGILTISTPIEVEAGVTYAVLANVWHVAGVPEYNNFINVYVEFWDDNPWWGHNDWWSGEAWKNQARAPWGTANRLADRSSPGTKTGDWEEIVVGAIAPTGAKYMTIGFWTAHRMLQLYVDDVQVMAVK